MGGGFHVLLFSFARTLDQFFQIFCSVYLLFLFNVSSFLLQKKKCILIFSAKKMYLNFKLKCKGLYKLFYKLYFSGKTLKL